MKDIVKKRYYRIEFTTASALCVGGNASSETDKDIACDSRGVPYISASALAGIYRALFPAEIADKYFGKVVINTGNTATNEVMNEDSKIIVYDANIKDEEWFVSKRDCVALDRFKTAIKGAKFDFQILEPGAKFVTYIEQNIYKDDVNVSDVIAEAWSNEEIKIGSKTTRGLGCVKNVEVKVLEFSFNDFKSIDLWLDFCMFDDDNIQWKNAANWDKITEKYSEGISQNRVAIKLDITQVSPITIRVYTTDVKPDDESGGFKAVVKSWEDFRHIAYKNKDNSLTYIIPGTSWAGVFKHHIESLGYKDTVKYFGCAGGKDKNSGKRSDIYFSESVIKNAKSKNISRNSIDRFTGGAVENALFTENVCYGGETSLEISVSKNTDEDFLKAVVASVADLNSGFMAIGGETSVGHGLFKITGIKCGNTEIDAENDGKALYSKLYEAMLAERKG